MYINPGLFVFLRFYTLKNKTKQNKQQTNNNTTKPKHKAEEREYYIQQIQKKKPIPHITRTKEKST